MARLRTPLTLLLLLWLAITLLTEFSTAPGLPPSAVIRFYSEDAFLWALLGTAAIIGHAANLYTTGAVQNTALRESAATIEREAQRLARLVDSMLFDARLAYVPLERATFDLADVVEEAVYAHDERAAQEGKSLEVLAPPDAMPVEGDRDLLARTFENLIDNSLKYTGSDGSVQIQIEAQPGGYAVQLVDNGMGIPPDYLPEILYQTLSDN